MKEYIVKEHALYTTYKKLEYIASNDLHSSIPLLLLPKTNDSLQKVQQ
jgi:hypothetical protein